MNTLLYGTLWLAPKQAAAMVGVSESTISRWIDKHGIGHKVSGRYRVNTTALLALIDNDQEALTAYKAGDMLHPSLKAYEVGAV